MIHVPTWMDLENIKVKEVSYKRTHDLIYMKCSEHANPQRQKVGENGK